MSKREKAYISLSVVITLLFLAIGASFCFRSYLRFFETICSLFESMGFYLCELFNIKHTIHIGILDSSPILEQEIASLPTSSPIFALKAKVYFRLLIDGNHYGKFFVGMGYVLKNLAYIVLIAIPFVVLFVVLMGLLYSRSNTDKQGKDTIPLKIFKKISGIIYQPVKRFVNNYLAYLSANSYWKKVWLVIWIFNINFASIIAATLAYIFYFTISFDFASIYPQIVNLLKDLLMVIRRFPWFITGLVAWRIFCGIRERKAMNTLRKHEARNCGFINSLPIVSMTCGSMGKKKTTMTTDMALSQTVMFRQEAFERLQKQDMKFPFFPWVLFEVDIKKQMNEGVIYNLASINKWIVSLYGRYENEEDPFDLYGYDVGRYGLFYDSGLKQEYIFEVLETYAKLYFIYVIESSLIVSNYSIRVEDGLRDSGNFPLRDDDVLDKCGESRFSHILDFDVLRLGRKVIENNKKAGSFEFGIVVITEVGKERANNLELKEIKKGSEETNQKNDQFNSWLKMCRHSATVDGFPFIKVFTDEQRPESWGADARDLAEIITIVDSSEMRLALPCFDVECWLYEVTFRWFLGLYYKFRHKRGDNTLLVHCLKSIVSLIYNHYVRIVNKYGYSVCYLETEQGTRKGKAKDKVYYLSNYKIYRERFSTDCFSDYFNDMAEKSGVGLKDYVEYAEVKANVEELKSQNSYFIRGLYGD